MEVDSLKAVVNTGAMVSSYGKPKNNNSGAERIDAVSRDAGPEKVSQQAAHQVQPSAEPDKSSNKASDGTELLKAKVKEEETISNEYFDKIIQEANEKIFITNRVFDYSFHDATNRVVIKVLDKTTREIIKEIPPEKNLDAVAKMMELVGIIIDEKI